MTTYISSLTIPQGIFMNPMTSTLLPVALGSAVGFALSPKMTRKTYMSLKQPPLRPPPWIFGPVWTVLYGIMGYAAHRAASTGLAALSSPSTVQTTREAMTIYSIQLAVNLIWTPLFFVAKRPVPATIDILALVSLNGYLTYLYSSVNEVSAWLQVPYLAWLSFATYLCIGTSALNDWDLTGVSTDPKKAN